MKYMIWCLVLGGLVGCASTPRSKWTDKDMRVMIDPDSVSPEHYVQIQNALVRLGKFTVVDRDAGMRALKKEQEREHRNETDRFENKEKWSMWGKMYGVGSIVVAHAQCYQTGSFWNPGKVKLQCRQMLSMVDSNTGEVFVAVEGENDGPVSADRSYIAPDWNDTVEKLVDAYPKDWERKSYAGPAQVYQQVAEEHAVRQMENNTRTPASVSDGAK